MIDTTTIISSSVVPRWVARAFRPVPLLVLPTDDMGIDPFAARLAIGAEADDLRLVHAVLAGEAVDVIHIPRIFRNVFRQVRTVPLHCVGRFYSQRLKPLLGGGKGAGIEFV